MFDHCGQGLSDGRRSGGRGRISNWRTLRALAVDGPQAVGAGVAAADDDHALALCRDEVLVRDVVAGAPLVLERQELHREVDALQVAPGDVEVAGPGGAAAEADGVELVREIGGADVDADVDAGAEGDPLGLHLLEPAVEEALLHLEVGDAVAEQAADAVGPLEDGDGVAGARQLLGAGQARRGRSRRRPPSCR